MTTDAAVKSIKDDINKGLINDKSELVTAIINRVPDADRNQIASHFRVWLLARKLQNKNLLGE